MLPGTPGARDGAPAVRRRGPEITRDVAERLWAAAILESGVSPDPDSEGARILERLAAEAEEAGEAEARERFLRPIAKGGQPRPVIPCDQECGAPLDPATAEEWRAAAEHWRSHPYLSGCSHGR